MREALDEINLERWRSPTTDRRTNRPERSGLELFVIAESQGESGARRLTEPTPSGRTELEAAISIRDRLMSAQEEIADLITEDDRSRPSGSVLSPANRASRPR